MNITINGNVTVNGNLTINEAKNLAEQGNLTLRQLRSVLPGTEGVKTPSRAWVREHMDGDEVLFTKDYGNGDRLVVFTNGFYRYGDKDWTVLRVDGFSKVYYEIDEEGKFESLGEDAFIDGSFATALVLNAMWQLKRNFGKRMSSMNESATDSEIMEGNADETVPDILEGIIEREEKAEEHERLQKAWETLTDQQKCVMWLIWVERLTEREAAKRMGITQQRVSTVLRQTVGKLRKNF